MWGTSVTLFSCSFTPWFLLTLCTDAVWEYVMNGFLSCTGITETVAQLASGWVTDRNLVHKYHYHKAYLILCGIVNLLSPLATSYIQLMIYAVFFAIFCGGYMALLLPVLVSTELTLRDNQHLYPERKNGSQLIILVNNVSFLPAWSRVECIQTKPKDCQVSMLYYTNVLYY